MLTKPLTAVKPYLLVSQNTASSVLLSGLCLHSLVSRTFRYSVWDWPYIWEPKSFLNRWF